MSRKFNSADTDKWLEGFGDGLDGDSVISSNATEAPIDASCSGSIGSYSLTATNASFAPGQCILIVKSRGSTTTNVGEHELNKIVAYSAGTITLKYPLQNAYNDSGNDQSQVRVMPEYNNFTINTGVTYTTKGWTGDVGGVFAILAKGTVTITGTLSALGSTGESYSVANGGGYRGGAYTSTAYGTPATSYQGEGELAAGGSTTAANGMSGGGGYCDGQSGDSGGGGGYATGGSTGSTKDGGTAGTGGGTGGIANLTTLLFGGSGGGGIIDGGGPASYGGNGGGIILIIAKNIVITGAININGGGSNLGGYATGGGGAGGSCLLKCHTATLGTNLITATGGVPATPGGGWPKGGNGGVGRIHLDYKLSYTGTTNPAIDVTQDLTLDYPPSGIGYMVQKFIEEDEGLYY